MTQAPGGGPTLPSPSREQVTEALVRLGGGPVTEGPLSFSVCDVMGVDTEGCPGAYELRRRFSWGVFRTRLRGLVEQGVVVVKTRQEWHDLSRGAVFGHVGHKTVQAYATAAAATAIRETFGPGASDALRARRELAVRRAEARVLHEHRALVAQYAEEFEREVDDRG